MQRRALCIMAWHMVQAFIVFACPNGHSVLHAGAATTVCSSMLAHLHHAVCPA